jgi:transglutaminase-like putative cysteine protease
MNLLRWQQAATAMLVVSGALVLGIEESDAALPVWSVAVAVGAFLVTDVLRWLELNRTAVNLAAIVAAAVGFYGFFEKRPDEQMVALARLLVYMQFILLLERKTPRVFWTLVGLSLVQVSVALALTAGGSVEVWFGVALLAYMVLGLAVLVLYVLTNDYRRAAGGEAKAKKENRSKGGSKAGERRRWPLLGRTSRFAPQESRHLTAGRMSWRLAASIITVIGGTLSLTAMVFAVVPRMQRSDWRGFVDPNQRQIGYSDQVRLGEEGEAQEDTDEVFQVRFRRFSDRSTYELRGEPLFRGNSFWIYNSAAAVWTSGAAQLEYESLDPSMPAIDEDLVEIDLTFSDGSRTVVFGIPPLHSIPGDAQFIIGHKNEQLLQGKRPLKQRLRMLTQGFKDGQPIKVYPARQDPRKIPGFTLTDRIRFPEGLVNAVRTVNDDALRDLVSREKLPVARTLDRYLRDSGSFQYSMNTNEIPVGMNPLEDFLVRSRQGNCEYFASALAVLLHQLDIPCRIVMGFKGGEWNSLGSYYQVRNSFAHTWVEVYLKPDEIPVEDRAKLPAADWSNGAWMVFDPTPAAPGALASAATDGGLPSIKEIVDYVDYLWTVYVLRLDATSQSESIYWPLILAFRRLAGAEGWKSVLAFFRQLIGVEEGAELADYFNWRAGVLAMVLALILAGMFMALRWVWRRVRGAFARRTAARAERPFRIVPFYQQLEALLARYSLRRRPSETQAEFARSLGEKIKGPAAPVPARITDAFYRVRFGNQTLNEPETADVEESLESLHAALRESTLAPHE